MSEYSGFARFYDELTGNISYKKRAEYFDTIISQYGNKKPKNECILLDLACGTGSMSFELADLGYDVMGIDSSYDMLSEAMAKNSQREKPLLFLCQKMQELDLYGTIDAVVCALDSLNHIIEPNDVAEVFRRVSLFLDKDAVFIFDVNTPYKHEKILADETFVYDCDGVYCVWQNKFEPKTCSVNISLDFFEEEDGAYYRSSESFTERAYSHEEIMQFAENAGMELLAVFEGDTFSAPKADTQRWVYVMKNKKLKQKI